MLLFLQGIIELISDLDYVLNATQNEKITDWETSQGQYFGRSRAPLLISYINF